MVNMKKKNKKKNISLIIAFIAGLIIYLTGLFILFCSTLTRIENFRRLFPNLVYTRNSLMGVKLLGCILFIIGFIIFMVSVVLLYKKDKIKENVQELIIEGKADVITIIVMTYLLIFMLVICLVFDQVIGALLFGITLLIQSVLNNTLIKCFKKNLDGK